MCTYIYRDAARTRRCELEHHQLNHIAPHEMGQLVDQMMGQLVHQMMGQASHMAHDGADSNVGHDHMSSGQDPDMRYHAPHIDASC